MDDRLLRTTLTANAAFSGLAGVATVVLAGQLSTPLGVPTVVLVVVGLGLLPWTALLWRARSRPTLRRPEALVAIAGDTAWVVASVVVVALSPGGLTPLGHWVIGVVALGVADFAALQVLGLRRLAPDRVVSRSPTDRPPAVR